MQWCDVIVDRVFIGVVYRAITGTTHEQLKVAAAEASCQQVPLWAEEKPP